MLVGNPLKNVGFQIKKGVSPHFIKTHNKKINQTKPKEMISEYDLELTK